MQIMHWGTSMKCIYFHHFWGVKSHNCFWYDDDDDGGGNDSGGGDDDDDDAYGKVVFYFLRRAK